MRSFDRRWTRPRSASIFFCKGFTLIEILVVVSIISILSFVVIPVYLEYRVRAQRTACISNMKEILNAEELFNMRHGRYTTTISDLCDASRGNCFLRVNPRCPCGGTYTFIEPTGLREGRVTCTGGQYAEGYAHELESDGGVPVGN